MSKISYLQRWNFEKILRKLTVNYVKKRQFT